MHLHESPTNSQSFEENSENRNGTGPSAGTHATSHTNSFCRPQAEEPSLAAAGPDRALARALERSRLVGGQLLKAEEEELARVDQLAQELLSSQYAAPSRPRPCAQAAEECVRCYAEHADDPLACAAAVEAYGQCAREAWREAAAKASGL